MPLDPAVAALLEQLKALPAIESLTPQAARALLAGMDPAPSVSTEEIGVEALAIPGSAGPIPARLYRNRRAAGLIVYFHGGGWTLGTLESVDAALFALSDRTGFSILSMDYRLAPKHPFPAAFDDAVDAVRWAAQHRNTIANPGTALIAGGDSAGANLAIGAAVALRAAIDPALDGLLLVYPVTDTQTDTGSYAEYGEGMFLTRPLMQWFMDHYLPQGVDRSDPRVAVLRTRDLSGMPPTLIQTAEYDPLRDEGEALGARLSDAGSEVTIDRRPGLIHGFFTMGAIIPAAADAVEDAAKWVVNIASRTGKGESA